MALNKSFEWLDIKKFQADPMATLKELGLESFPHLAGIVATCLQVINIDRSRKSVLRTEKPFLRNHINDINDLHSIAKSVTTICEKLQISMLHSLSLAQKNQRQFSLHDFISTSSHSALNGDAVVDLPWNLDIGDLFAVQTLILLDKAHANIMDKKFDAALQLYATAKQHYDQLVTELVLPQTSWMRVAKEIGRSTVISHRATAGGRALKEKTQRERDAIRPFVYDLLKHAKPHERKTPNAAFTYLYPKLHSEMMVTPPPGMPEGFEMSVSAFKSVVKDYMKTEHSINS